MNTKAKPIDPIAAFDEGVDNPSPVLPIDDGSGDVDNSGDELDEEDPEGGEPEGEEGEQPTGEGKPPKPAEPKEPVEPEKPAEPVKPAEPAKPAEEDPAKAKAAHDKQVADEAKQLGLSERATKRFTAMSDKIRELETKDSSAALAKPLEGLVDFKGKPEEVQQQIAKVAQRARDADAMDAMIVEINAPVESMQVTFGYLKDIFGKGATPETRLRAHATLTKELDWLGKQIGVKTPGYNPLDEHADLKDRVARGDLGEADALEIIKGRARDVAHAAHQQQTDAATSQERATLAATDELKTVGSQLRARDGADYDARMALIRGPVLDAIVNNYPPKEWAAKVQEKYAQLGHIRAQAPAAPAPAAARKPIPGRAPMRQSVGGGQGTVNVQKATNAMAAFDEGVEEFKAQRGMI